MDAENLLFRSHSAQVHMELRLPGLVLRISHLGPDFLIVTQPVDHPPVQAEILMSIDGKERRWPVWLPAGLSSASGRTIIAPCRGAETSVRE